LRLLLITASIVCLGACTPASPAPVVAPAPSSLPAATPTAFLPRGFVGLPSAPVGTGTAGAPRLSPSGQTAETPDLSAAADRLNLLRAEDGLGALLRVAPLDRLAQGRAEAVAADGALRHPNDGQGTELGVELRSEGFSGGVAEVILSVDVDHQDLLGLMLQALLTDPANRGVVLGASYRRLGLGAARGKSSWFIVGLLAEEGPSR
jgi:uncharacterized protein YkwD